jgi:GTP-binding protein
LFSSLPDVFDSDREEAILAKKELLARRRGTDKNKNGQNQVKDDEEWKFFDTARCHVTGGDGGNGCVSFRREKGEAMGGPNGGSGGRGGSVWLVCDESVNTLAPLRNRVHIKAGKARNGLGKGKHGQKGRDIIMPVPPGTVIRELHTQKMAGELKEHGEKMLVARGGRGGRGNAAFKTDRNTAPKLAERAEPGVQRWLSVELRLVADVGFLGKPNAGKSTLLAAASAARPKIANYPFTTIVPNLGVCDISDEGAGLVLCDIPGLIEG